MSGQNARTDSWSWSSTDLSNIHLPEFSDKLLYSDAHTPQSTDFPLHHFLFAKTEFYSIWSSAIVNNRVVSFILSNFTKIIRPLWPFHEHRWQMVQLMNWKLLRNISYGSSLFVYQIYRLIVHIWLPPIAFPNWRNRMSLYQNSEKWNFPVSELSGLQNNPGLSVVMKSFISLMTDRRWTLKQRVFTYFFTWILQNTWKCTHNIATH